MLVQTRKGSREGRLARVWSRVCAHVIVQAELLVNEISSLHDESTPRALPRFPPWSSFPTPRRRHLRRRVEAADINGTQEATAAVTLMGLSKCVSGDLRRLFRVRRRRSRLRWRAPGAASSSPSPCPSHPNRRGRGDDVMILKRYEIFRASVIIFEAPKGSPASAGEGPRRRR